MNYVVDGIEYADLWAALAAPLHPGEIEIKNFPAKGTPYTTSETVVKRLNHLAPGNWHTSIYFRETAQIDGSVMVVCSLTIDGSTRSSTGLGAPDVQKDGKVNYQSFGGPGIRAEAQAFKRAARLFGIALELWVDAKGSVAKAEQWAKNPESRQATTPQTVPEGNWYESEERIDSMLAIIQEKHGYDHEVVRKVLQLPSTKEIASIHDAMHGASELSPKDVMDMMAAHARVEADSETPKA